MKTVAEEEPIVPVVEVARPIQIRLALGIVPPHIARLLVALEGCVRNAVCDTISRRPLKK
jgi:hypothetical protein